MSIQQIEVANANANLDFKSIPTFGINGTYTVMFRDKPVAKEFAEMLLTKKAKVWTANNRGEFQVSWDGPYVDTDKWRKDRLRAKGIIK